MNENIFENSKSSTDSIFKDESVFYVDFIPEKVHCRDTQVNEIKTYLEPLIQGKKANNILIYGPPGTGKTLLSQYVLKNLVNYTRKAKYKYVNAIQDSTRFSIFSKIAHLFSLALPRRGLAIDELLDRIKEELAKSSFTPIILIDEIDQLNSDQCSKLLYDLSRISSNSNYFCVILITNYKDFILKLDPRTKSSLFLEDIKFNTYNSKELKKIVKQRVDYGLQPDVISNELIDFIAGFASSRGGDARIAIDLLYKGAKRAYKEGKHKITKDILVNATQKVDLVKLSENFKYLNSQERKLLKVLENGMKSSQVYLKTKMPERSIRRYLKNLEKLNLIRLKIINTNKGRTRKIYLNYNKKVLD